MGADNHVKRRHQIRELIIVHLHSKQLFYDSAGGMSHLGGKQIAAQIFKQKRISDDQMRSEP